MEWYVIILSAALGYLCGYEKATVEPTKELLECRRIGMQTTTQLYDLLARGIK